VVLGATLSERVVSTGDRAFCSRAASLTVTFNANAQLADSRPWRLLLSRPFQHSVHRGVQVTSFSEVLCQFLRARRDRLEIRLRAESRREIPECSPTRGELRAEFER